MPQFISAKLESAEGKHLTVVSWFVPGGLFKPNVIHGRRHAGHPSMFLSFKETTQGHTVSTVHLQAAPHPWVCPTGRDCTQQVLLLPVSTKTQLGSAPLGKGEKLNRIKVCIFLVMILL